MTDLFRVWAQPRGGGARRRLGIRKGILGRKRVVWLSEGADQRLFTLEDRRTVLAAWRRSRRGRRYRVTTKRVVLYPDLVVDSDTRLPRAELSRALQRVATRLRVRLFIREGWRTRARQQELWDAYVARGYAPPIVARPGTSRHESGNAADVGVIVPGDADGISLRDYPGAVRAAAAEGIRFTVPSEPWHAEL